MSDTTGNKELDTYLKRDASVLGRTINWITDTVRETVGRPGIWKQAAEYDANEDRIRQAQSSYRQYQIDATNGISVEDAWAAHEKRMGAEMVRPALGVDLVARSGLSAADQKAAMSLITGLETHYPKASQQTRDAMVAHSIKYIQERAQERLAQNQLNLFTDAALAQARPFDREAGLAKLENLALLMRDAEEQMTDDLSIPDDQLIRPWDLVEDQMEVVYRDPSAMRIAETWGFLPTDHGPPLTARNGTALQSVDLLEAIRHERELAQEPDYEAMCENIDWDDDDEDPARDYAEAYADVAGDPTLSWRLENEDPRDILDDVRQQARREAGLDRRGHSNDNGIDL